MFELVENPDEFVFGGRQAGRTLKMGVKIGAELQRAKSLWEVVEELGKLDVSYRPDDWTIPARAWLWNKLVSQGIERPK